MEINHKKLLSYMAELLGLEEGRYLAYHKTGGDKLAIIRVDKAKNVVSDDYNDLGLEAILTSPHIELKKLKSEPAKYYYFDDEFRFMEKDDVNDKLDDFNKANHNYFPAKEFGKDMLIRQLQHHIRNMRLNLLANFYPSLEE